jgi:hypothetical protein
MGVLCFLWVSCVFWRLGTAALPWRLDRNPAAGIRGSFIGVTTDATGRNPAAGDSRPPGLTVQEIMGHPEIGKLEDTHSIKAQNRGRC